MYVHMGVVLSVSVHVSCICGGERTCICTMCVCVSTPLPSLKVLPPHLFSMILCTILSVVSQLPLSTIFKIPICLGTCKHCNTVNLSGKVHTPQLDIPWQQVIIVCLSVCAHSLFADDTNEDEDYRFYLQPEVLLLARQQILLTRSKESSSHEVL